MTTFGSAPTHPVNIERVRVLRHTIQTDAEGLLPTLIMRAGSFASRQVIDKAAPSDTSVMSSESET